MRYIKKITLSCLILCLSSAEVKAQESPVSDLPVSSFDDSSAVFPQFSYRNMDISEFIIKKVRYPKEMLNQNQTASVKVDFIVTKEGKVESVMCRDTAGINNLFIEEAIRVVKLTDGRWKPGI